MSVQCEARQHAATACLVTTSIHSNEHVAAAILDGDDHCGLLTLPRPVVGHHRPTYSTGEVCLYDRRECRAASALKLTAHLLSVSPPDCRWGRALGGFSDYSGIPTTVGDSCS